MHTHTHSLCHLGAVSGATVQNRYKILRHPAVKTGRFSKEDDAEIMAYGNANCDEDGRMILGAWGDLAIRMGRDGEALVMVLH